MATVREASEADISRIIELYEQLTISKPAAEVGRSPSPEDYREVFARIREQPGHELVVVDEQGTVTGTMVFLIVPNLSHQGLPWATIENMVVEENNRRGGVGRLLID
ncbi:MAG: GNAT family N-acetyltransferase, partial [Dehalococcoidales bacterium]